MTGRCGSGNDSSVRGGDDGIQGVLCAVELVDGGGNPVAFAVQIGEQVRAGRSEPAIGVDGAGQDMSDGGSAEPAASSVRMRWTRLMSLSR